MKLFIVLFLFGLSTAATIQLIDGSQIFGEIIENQETQYVIKPKYSDDNVIIEKTKVLSVSFDEHVQRLAPGAKSYNANRASDRIVEAGEDLKSFTGQYYMGFGLQVLGYVIMFTAEDEDAFKAGGITVLVGSLIQFFSFSKIGRAGDNLIMAGKNLEPKK